jgi:CheY-like chemotaxis protein
MECKLGDRPRILVVGDDVTIRAALTVFGPNHELELATSKDECYDHLQSSAFDLILLDVRVSKAPWQLALASLMGYDILTYIKTHHVVQRGSTVPLPVLLIMAQGSEPLSVWMRVDHDANVCDPTPIGEGEKLQHAITQALGTAVHEPVPSIVGSPLRLSFHPSADIVRIESLTYRGVDHEILFVLRELYLADRAAQRPPAEHRGILGDELAKKLKISGMGVRRRITRFRQRVKTDFERSFGRTLDDNDIIQNERGRDGYRLNPLVVRIDRWVNDPW